MEKVRQHNRKATSGILLCSCLVLNWMLLKLGTGSGEREARTGSRERGRGNRERVTGKGNGKKGAGNDHPQTLRFAFVKKTDATINSSGHKQ